MNIILAVTLLEPSNLWLLGDLHIKRLRRSKKILLNIFLLPYWFIDLVYRFHCSFDDFRTSDNDCIGFVNFFLILSHVSKSAWGLSVTIFFFFRSLLPTRRVKQRHFGLSLFQPYAFLSLSCAPHSIRSRPSAKSFAKRISRLTIFSSTY